MAKSHVKHLDTKTLLAMREIGQRCRNCGDCPLTAGGWRCGYVIEQVTTELERRGIKMSGEEG